MSEAPTPSRSEVKERQRRSMEHGKRVRTQYCHRGRAAVLPHTPPPARLNPGFQLGKRGARNQIVNPMTQAS
jgi:hypothetical protein